MDLNWRWFMSVDFNGNWIMTKGGAHLEIESNNISGFMSFENVHKDDSDIYAKFSAYVKDDDSVVMTVSSQRDGVPSFEVSGPFFSLEIGNASACTLVLTDGTTVIGFAKHEAQ